MITRIFTSNRAREQWIARKIEEGYYVVSENVMFNTIDTIIVKMVKQENDK